MQSCVFLQAYLSILNHKPITEPKRSITQSFELCIADVLGNCRSAGNSYPELPCFQLFKLRSGSSCIPCHQFLLCIPVLVGTWLATGCRVCPRACLLRTPPSGLCECGKQACRVLTDTLHHCIMPVFTE